MTNINKWNSQWTNNQINKFKSFLERYNINLKNDDLKYFEQAFTHQSYTYENKLDYNYEKLEFYGDALIEKEVSSYLFDKKDLNEKDMTSNRKKMVQHKTLSKIAEDLKFEEFILVGSSYNLKNIGANNYEDVFESFCAALYLTHGEKALRHFINETIIYYFEHNLIPDNEDYKSIFQEKMQRNEGKNNIEYVLTKEDKINNEHIFHVSVRCDGMIYGTGVANKKHEAENLAAKNALEKNASNS